MIAKAALPLYEAEAKERMLAGVKNPDQKIVQGSRAPQAAERAAKDFGTNRQPVYQE